MIYDDGYFFKQWLIDELRSAHDALQSKELNFRRWALPIEYARLTWGKTYNDACATRCTARGHKHINLGLSIVEQGYHGGEDPQTISG